MMKILPDDLDVNNPCEECEYNTNGCSIGGCHVYFAYEKILSILNQCKEVDLDKQRELYSTYLWNTDDVDPKSFSQFIQSEIQEGK